MVSNGHKLSSNASKGPVRAGLGADLKLLPTTAQKAPNDALPTLNLATRVPVTSTATGLATVVEDQLRRRKLRGRGV
jgi:hypothetical protein